VSPDPQTDSLPRSTDAASGSPARDRRSLASRIPREFFGRSLGMSVWAAGRTWLGIALTWFVVGMATDSAWLWLIWPLAVVLIGTFQYHLNVLGHDGLHFLLADSRVANDFICRWLLHGPHGAPLGSMRRNHLNHHTQFGSDADLDRQYYDTRRHKNGTRFLIWLMGSLAGGMTLPIALKLMGLGTAAAPTAAAASRPPVPDRPAGRWTDITAVVVSQAWIAAAIAWATGWWWAYLVLWALPLVTVMMGLNTIRSCLEHAQPASGEPGLHTFRSNPVERFFLSPFNMNVHAEHHLVPAVPWHRLPRLNRFLAESGLGGPIVTHPGYVQRARVLARSVG